MGVSGEKGQKWVTSWQNVAKQGKKQCTSVKTSGQHGQKGSKKSGQHCPKNTKMDKSGKIGQ